MLTDDQILRSNPWWSDPEWERGDAHMRRLRAQPARLPSPHVHQIDLQRPGIHILRGPRQVGKSTDLKLLVVRALDERLEPRRCIYLALDLLERQPVAALVASIDRTLELAAARGHPRLLLLDEVTSVESWRTAVKVVWDEGRIDEDVVVCTGSSAIDLARGAAERLPGRRGTGRDLLVLPQDFGAFARAVEPTVPPAPRMTVGEILSPSGREEIGAQRIHLPALRRALERYLVFGGLPAAVAEAIAGEPTPTEDVQRVLWDSLVKEIQRRGAAVPAAQALLERIMRSLGSKVSWARLAEEMHVPLGGRGARPDPRTVQSYIELLAIDYFGLILYFWKADSGTGGLAKDKKLYFGDPLLHTITADRVALPRDRHAGVENAIALALYRRYEPPERSAENMLAPERLHVWGTRSGGEIDFVCGPHDEIEAVEVADWTRLNRQKATAPMRALPGRPSIVATRDRLEFGRTANLVPAAMLLWAVSG